MSDKPLILVCDDEPQILRALRVTLRNEGFDVLTAATAAEALDAAALQAPDAAILDLVLPDGDGIEIAVVEHFGKRFAHMQSHMSPTANRIRTAPLWGVRLRSRLMHDGESLTLRDAIGRHAGEAKAARDRYDWDAEAAVLLAFYDALEAGRPPGVGAAG